MLKLLPGLGQVAIPIRVKRSSYVTEGEGEILVEGQPTRKVKAGDGFVIPNGAKHDAHNTGAGPLKLVGVYVVEKGKPLATPAP